MFFESKADTKRNMLHLHDAYQGLVKGEIRNLDFYFQHGESYPTAPANSLLQPAKKVRI